MALARMPRALRRASKIGRAELAADLEDNDVGFDGFEVEADAFKVVQRLGKQAGVGVIFM